MGLRTGLATMNENKTKGDRMTFPRMTRRTFSLASLSLATIGTVGPVPSYALGEDNVRHGIQIGALGALRTLLSSIEKKHGLKYDVKDFRDSTSALLARDQRRHGRCLDLRMGRRV